MYHSIDGDSGNRPSLAAREGGLESRPRIVLRQEMNRGAVLTPIALEAGKPRQAPKAQVHLQAGARAAIGLDPRAKPRRIGAAEQRLEPERIGIDQHDRRPVHIPLLRDHPRNGATLDFDESDGDTCQQVGARTLGRVGKRRGDRPHPATNDHPRAVGARKPAQVVQQEVHPAAGTVPIPEVAGEAIGHGVHRLEELALELEATEVRANRAAAQINEDIS